MSQTFANVVETGTKGDARRTTEAIESASRLGASRVIEAVASNLTHNFWSTLSELIPHTYDAKIAPHFGEIGIPLIATLPEVEEESERYIAGIPVDRDEIESYKAFPERNNFYDEAPDAEFSDPVYSADPHHLRYSTNNGRIVFGGYKCKIPMIVKPTNESELNTFIDTHILVQYAPTVIKLACGLLAKQGDSAVPTLISLGQQGEVDLYRIEGGAITVAPIKVASVIQRSQDYQ